MLFDDLAIISIKFGNQFDYFGLVQNKVHYILEKGQAPAMSSLNALLFIKPIPISAQTSNFRKPEQLASRTISENPLKD